MMIKLYSSSLSDYLNECQIRANCNRLMEVLTLTHFSLTHDASNKLKQNWLIILTRGNNS